VNYLSGAFSSRSLATTLTANLKRGLKLAYLPDPVKFNKPQYNLKISLLARFFTPGVAIQWPDSFDRIGPWLFSSIMEYFGSGSGLDGELFQTKPAQQPQRPREGAAPVPVPEAEHPRAEIKQEPIVTPAKSDQPRPKAVPLPEEAPGQETRKAKVTRLRDSAAMSRVQYPDFFANLELKQKRVPKKEPFS
jgi:hypothetical protein